MNKEVIKIIIKVFIYALGLIGAYFGVTSMVSCSVNRSVSGSGTGILQYVDTFKVNHGSTLKLPRQLRSKRGRNLFSFSLLNARSVASIKNYCYVTQKTPYTAKLHCYTWRHKTLVMECFAPKSVCVRRKFGRAHWREVIEVPCGKCLACRSNLRSDWIFRLKQHMKTAKTAYFVTLTYSDDNIPLSKNGYPTLCKDAVKTFLHDWRNKIEKDYQESLRLSGVPLEKRRKLHHRIKYFLVGEYGGDNGRPHYHFVLFDYKYSNIELERSLKPFFPDIIDIRYCTGARIGYITKYMLKDIDDDFPDDVERPFRLMSKGLGSNFVSDDNARFLSYNGENFVMSDGDYKRRLPRYLREKFIPRMIATRLNDDGVPFDGIVECVEENRLRKRFSEKSQLFSDLRQQKYDKEYGEMDRKRVLRGGQPVFVERHENYERYVKKLMEDKQLNSKLQYYG